MRLRKREVKNIQEIYGILARCKTVHVGINGDKYPYVVPVSFGMEVIEGVGMIYFHCSKKGHEGRAAQTEPVCVR